MLADIFSRLKYMESRCSGFKKILAGYEGKVEFDETKMLVFEADNYVMNANDTKGNARDGTQDKLQKQIFDMIEENSQISTPELHTIRAILFIIFRTKRHA